MFTIKLFAGSWFSRPCNSVSSTYLNKIYILVAGSWFSRPCNSVFSTNLNKIYILVAGSSYSKPCNSVSSTYLNKIYICILVAGSSYSKPFDVYWIWTNKQTNRQTSQIYRLYLYASYSWLNGWHFSGDSWVPRRWRRLKKKCWKSTGYAGHFSKNLDLRPSAGKRRE